VNYKRMWGEIKRFKGKRGKVKEGKEETEKGNI
jgi:hypothetical protein